MADSADRDGQQLGRRRYRSRHRGAQGRRCLKLLTVTAGKVKVCRYDPPKGSDDKLEVRCDGNRSGQSSRLP
jgi:hypothetical protein